MQSHLLLPLALVPAKPLGGVAKRMRIPAVVGEIAAGVVFGPALLGFLPSELSAAEGDSVFHVLAQIGLCVLLFKIGLETRLSNFIKVRQPATITAVAGMDGTRAARMPRHRGKAGRRGDGRGILQLGRPEQPEMKATAKRTAVRGSATPLPGRRAAGGRWSSGLRIASGYEAVTGEVLAGTVEAIDHWWRAILRIGNTIL